ncbi:DNA cytosine methyltransferase [Candidatus Cyanaurora vandensis]|uniref:DNA cytosine methyltransferase n=1 Tax=Candidatus Cyanaurora vandensis TaxID=2714958 RepID=UPI0037BFDFD0
MIEPKMNALSLFSGAGGIDIGIQSAGFEVLACIETDPHCCETLRAATIRQGRNTRVIEADIRAVNPQELMSDLALRR